MIAQADELPSEQWLGGREGWLPPHARLVFEAVLRAGEARHSTRVWLVDVGEALVADGVRAQTPYFFLNKYKYIYKYHTLNVLIYSVYWALKQTKNVFDKRGVCCGLQPLEVPVGTR